MDQVFTLNDRFGINQSNFNELPKSIAQRNIRSAQMSDLQERVAKQCRLDLRGEYYVQTGRPLVTVVTVVFNGVDDIEETIVSVTNQTYDNIEYIVIDGGSTDLTVEIIKKYEKSIDYWLSEVDDGIYCAMNKAISFVNGSWLIFMNSGDAFYSTTTVADIFDKPIINFDVIYGQYIVEYQSKRLRRVKANNIMNLWRGMVTSHQSVFIRSDLVKDVGFDCNFKLAADYDLLAKLFRLKCKFFYLKNVISVVSAEGKSDAMRMTVLDEYERISARYFSEKPYRIYFFYKRIEFLCRWFAKKILPSRLVRRMQAAK